jgi:hypothetical protein
MPRTTIRVGAGTSNSMPSGRGKGTGWENREFQILTAQGRPIADPDDLEPLLVPARHAFHHVRDQRAGEAVKGPVEALVVGPLHPNRAVVLDDTDLAMEGLLERPSGSLDSDAGSVDVHLDPARDLDRLLPDPTH